MIFFCCRMHFTLHYALYAPICIRISTIASKEVALWSLALPFDEWDHGDSQFFQKRTKKIQSTSMRSVNRKRILMFYNFDSALTSYFWKEYTSSKVSFCRGEGGGRRGKIMGNLWLFMGRRRLHASGCTSFPPPPPPPPHTEWLERLRLLPKLARWSYKAYTQWKFNAVFPLGDKQRSLAALVAHFLKYAV